MILLHDPRVRDSIELRIKGLSPTTARRWGKMTAGQMLWHCNQALKTSLREVQVVPRRPPFPVAVLKFMLFRLPWPHGAPTAPEYVAESAHDFEAEQARCLELIDRFVSQDLEAGPWGRAVFGEISGREWSCLHARHIDHHLKQFGA